jgi:hypothetical protein
MWIASFLKHTFWSVLMWQKHTSKCCQICHPWMGSRGSCTINCTNLLDDRPYCVTSWVSFPQFKPSPWVLVRICKHYILPKNSRHPSLQCKEASWTLSIWESHDVPKCWVGSYPCGVGFYVLGGWVPTLLGKKEPSVVVLVRKNWIWTCRIQKQSFRKHWNILECVNELTWKQQGWCNWDFTIREIVFPDIDLRLHSHT